MRDPIVLGRDFNDSDTANGPRVVIVNQAMAKRYWPDGSARGKFIQLDYVPGETLRQVVGVVGDLRLSRRQLEPEAVVYVPFQQQPAQWPGPGIAEEGTVISTFFSTRKCFRTRAGAIAGSIALLACGGSNALAQSNALTPGFFGASGGDAAAAVPRGLAAAAPYGTAK
jgi:MacB-like periplasmic core domain